jgi:hypothetical protein
MGSSFVLLCGPGPPGFAWRGYAPLVLVKAWLPAAPWSLRPRLSLPAAQLLRSLSKPHPSGLIPASALPSVHSSCLISPPLPSSAPPCGIATARIIWRNHAAAPGPTDHCMRLPPARRSGIGPRTSVPQQTIPPIPSVRLSPRHPPPPVTFPTPGEGSGGDRMGCGIRNQG